MRRIRLTTVDGKPRLRYLSSASLDEFRYGSGNASGRPLYFTIHNDEMELAPTPDQNYGALGGVWLDGTYWHFADQGYPWNLPATRDAFIHELQTGCLVVNNGHAQTFADSDIIVYEGGTFGAAVPGGNTAPAEYVDTIRGDKNWFWKAAADTPLTAATILATLAILKANNSAYMLNAGPDTTGQIPSQLVTVLTAVGAGLP